MIQTEPKLRSIKFAVGFKCNLSCGFCLQQLEDKSPMLKYEFVERVLGEDMVKQDVKLITLTGGEPTFTPYSQLSLDIVRLAKKSGMETCIFTNGTTLDQKVLDSYQEAGLTRFRVSLYDPIDWTRVSNLMKNLKERGFPAMTKYTISKENYSNLQTTLENLVNSEIEWFQIKPYNRIEVEEVDKKYELSSSQVLQMSKTLLEYKQSHPGVRVDLLPLCYEFLVSDITTEELSPCNCGKGPNGYLVVGPTGDVRICGAYPEPIGNIQKDSITDLWRNHPLLREVRNLANRSKPDECIDCSFWEKCSLTDCHSATYSKYGNFNHGNPQCPRLTNRKE